MTAPKKRARKLAQAERGRDMPLREDGQLYARVTKMLGNNRVMAACGDGQERLCTIRGSMRRREWVRVGDVVLVALRDFQDDKADVVFKYKDDEVHRLKRLGEDVVAAPQDDDDDAGADDDVVAFEHDPDDPDVWHMI
jgi:translation initiation factor 1A